eukprot:765988-Hanusia_phi.AAC.8
MNFFITHVKSPTLPTPSSLLHPQAPFPGRAVTPGLVLHGPGGGPPGPGPQGLAVLRQRSPHRASPTSSRKASPRSLRYRTVAAGSACQVCGSKPRSDSRP